MNKVLQYFNVYFTACFVLVCFFITSQLSYSKESNKDQINIQSFNRNFKNYNSKLQIFNKEQKEIASFKVAIADSEEKRNYGLMNLKKLPKNYAMLFLFDEKEIVTMWMKNTYIPLDMIFIDGDKIVFYEEMTKPHSLKIISSKFPADKVLEINSGDIKRFNIRIGQTIKLQNQ